MKRFIIPVAAAGALLLGGVAFATQGGGQDKVALCHKTDSKSNPWVVQEVNANEVKSHLGNGDKLYTGPFGIHTDQAKAWCAGGGEPTPTPSVTPSPSPSASPSPSVTPSLSPSPTPSGTPKPSTSPELSVSHPAALPAVGGTGRNRP